MEICILSNKFFTGGFTSSLLPLLHHLAEKGIKTDLMLFEKTGMESMVPQGINVIYNTTPKKPLPKWKKAIKLFKTPHFLAERKKAKNTQDKDIQYRYNVFYGQALTRIGIGDYSQKCDLSKYDCVIAWEENFTSYFLSHNVTAKKKIGYIHPDYQKAKFSTFVDEEAYSGLDYIACVSKATQKSLAEAIPSLAKKAICIPNTLVVDKILEKAAEEIQTFEKSAFDMVSVCRLDNVSKALDRAVTVSALLKKDGLNFKWYFVGDGPFKENMTQLIKQNNLQDTVILLGEKANPHPYTKNADLFVLQSYYEGKPMSVAEAMIIETPVLISNFAAAAEQVQEGVTGFIAQNNQEDIYRRLKDLMENKEKLAPIRENLAKLNKKQTFEDITPFLNAVEN